MCTCPSKLQCGGLHAPERGGVLLAEFPDVVWWRGGGALWGPMKGSCSPNTFPEATSGNGDSFSSVRQITYSFAPKVDSCSMATKFYSMWVSRGPDYLTSFVLVQYGGARVAGPDGNACLLVLRLSGYVSTMQDRIEMESGMELRLNI